MQNHLPAAKTDHMIIIHRWSVHKFLILYRDFNFKWFYLNQSIKVDVKIACPVFFYQFPNYNLLSEIKNVMFLWGGLSEEG